MPQFKSLVVCLLVFTFKNTAYAAPTIDPVLLAKDFQYYSVKLSPDAKHIAIGVIHEGKQRLAVIDSQTFQPVGGASFGGIEEVGNFHWVNDKRLVIQMLQKEPWETEALFYGELYAVDLDGKRGKIIYGYRAGEKQTGTNLSTNKNVRGWGEVINYLPDDEKNILISSTPQSKSGGIYPTVHKLNVKSGKLGPVIARSPVGFADFMTDKQGNVRAVIGVDEDFNKRAYLFDYETKDWTEVSSEFGGAFTPLAIDDSGDNLFYIDNYQQDKTGVFKLNLTTGKYSEIYTDKEVGITDVAFSSDGNSVYALRVDPSYPTYVMFNSENEEATLYKSLLATFEGFEVKITSRSADGNVMIVHTRNERSPSTYYLYDRSTNQLSLLFADFSHIDGTLFSSSTPISFDASDGQKIHGYLSRPISAPADANIPLVVLVHGGPRSRDYWEFDREVQLLTSQGYGVLRVNFRGSDGYGSQFLAAGNKHWGDRIQQDIIEGTKWALAQGGFDSHKVCIMGASFGGYSAVQSATLEPDLYQCVVANAGVYDLELTFKEGDIQDRLWGKSYLELVLGSDESLMRQFSPVNNVEKLSAPVFIVHGKKDRRVPFEHAEALKKAMDQANKPYEWFVKSSETHGFHDQENRAEYYQHVTQFLAKYLQ